MTEEEDQEKYYCWNCGIIEIPEPVGCCSGHDCGCMGLPIDPPFCSDKCMGEYRNKKRLEFELDPVTDYSDDRPEQP